MLKLTRIKIKIKKTFRKYHKKQNFRKNLARYRLKTFNKKILAAKILFPQITINKWGMNCKLTSKIKYRDKFWKINFLKIILIKVKNRNSIVIAKFQKYKIKN